jgi:hypothetical protein
VEQDGQVTAAYDYDDVCFAKLREIVYAQDGNYFSFQQWQCLVTDEHRLANPVRAADSNDPAGMVKFTVSDCQPRNATGLDGVVFAFVHAPLSTQISEKSFTDWVEENAAEILLVGMFGSFAWCALCFWCSRLYKQRALYKEAKHMVDEEERAVQYLSKFGGNAKGDDPDMAMTSNPMVITYDALSEAEMKRRAKLQRYLQKAHALRVSHINDLTIEKESRYKELQDLKLMLHRAQSKTIVAVRKHVHVPSENMTLEEFQARHSDLSSDDDIPVTFEDDDDDF